jgi:hypothetical protein
MESQEDSKRKAIAVWLLQYWQLVIIFLIFVAFSVVLFMGGLNPIQAMWYALDSLYRADVATRGPHSGYAFTGILVLVAGLVAVALVSIVFVIMKRRSKK